MHPLSSDVQHACLYLLSLLHPQLWQLADIRFPIVPRYRLLLPENHVTPPKSSYVPLPPPPRTQTHTSLTPKKCFLMSKGKNVTYETTSALQKNTFPVSGTTRKLLFNTGGDSVNVTKKIKLLIMITKSRFIYFF